MRQQPPAFPAPATSVVPIAMWNGVPSRHTHAEAVAAHGASRGEHLAFAAPASARATPG